MRRVGEELLETILNYGSLITQGESEFAYALIGRGFHMPEMPNGNNFALISPVYAPGVEHHRGRHAPMR